MTSLITKMHCAMMHTNNGPAGGTKGKPVPCVHCGRNYDRVSGLIVVKPVVTYHWSQYGQNWSERHDGKPYRYVSGWKVPILCFFLGRKVQK